MEILLDRKGTRIRSDLRLGTSIAIDMNFDLAQPNHFGVDFARRQSVVVGEFVGSTQRGGPCNVDRLSLIPHCNGTHTESVGHIVDDSVPVAACAREAMFLARLITVRPSTSAGMDTYSADLQPGDSVISRGELDKALGESCADACDALVVRTLPNDDGKRSRLYGEHCAPAFFSTQAMEYIAGLQFDHLLVDLPSIDRSHDGGLLSNHHLFWNLFPQSKKLSDDTWCHKTITEMIYVPDSIADGRYLLNLQIAPWICDAAPSRPILFPVSFG